MPVLPKTGEFTKRMLLPKDQENFSFSQKIWCRTQTVSYEGNFKSQNRQSARHKSAYYPRTVPIRWYHFCRIRPQVLVIFAKILLRFVCIGSIMNNLRGECTNFKLEDLKCFIISRVVKLLACGARGPGFDSRPPHLDFQRLVISCFQVEIWLKDR